MRWKLAARLDVVQIGGSFICLFSLKVSYLLVSPALYIFYIIA